MGRAFRAGGLFLFVGVLLPTLAAAFTPTLSSSGVAVRWPGRAVTLDIVGNPVNASGMDAQSFFDAATRSLQRWETASGGSVRFDYWQGTDASVYEPNSNYNGLSSVYFA